MDATDWLGLLLAVHMLVEALAIVLAVAMAAVVAIDSRANRQRVSPDQQVRAILDDRLRERHGPEVVLTRVG